MVTSYVERQVTASRPNNLKISIDNLSHFGILLLLLLLLEVELDAILYQDLLIIIMYSFLV